MMCRSADSSRVVDCQVLHLERADPVAVVNQRRRSKHPQYSNSFLVMLIAKSIATRLCTPSDADALLEKWSTLPLCARKHWSKPMVILACQSLLTTSSEHLSVWKSCVEELWELWVSYSVWYMLWETAPQSITSNAVSFITVSLYCVVGTEPSPRHKPLPAIPIELNVTDVVVSAERRPRD